MELRTAQELGTVGLSMFAVFYGVVLAVYPGVWAGPQYESALENAPIWVWSSILIVGGVILLIGSVIVRQPVVMVGSAILSLFGGYLGAMFYLEFRDAGDESGALGPSIVWFFLGSLYAARLSLYRKGM